MLNIHLDTLDKDYVEHILSTVALRLGCTYLQKYTSRLLRLEQLFPTVAAFAKALQFGSILL